MAPDQNLVEQSISDITDRLPLLKTELSEEQIDFVLHDIRVSCHLKACPGSGKTEVVGIKAAYEIAAWNNPYSGMAILSFTKNAAKEIADRISKYSGAGRAQYPHFVGTIDSWLHGYILHPFAYKASGYAGSDGDKSYRLVDNEDRYDFLNAFATVFSLTPYKDAWVNDYYYECTEPLSIQSQSRNINLASITPQQLNDLWTNKKKFLKAGLTTYADAELLCYVTLKKNEKIIESLVKRFPIFFVDECQDLSFNQLAILKLLVDKGAIVHLIGDNKQSIYEFKKVYVENIQAFIRENGMVEKALTKNFRSNQQIVNVCSALGKYNSDDGAQNIAGNEVEITENCCLLWEYTNDEFPNLPQKFIDKMKAINTSIPEGSPKILIDKSGVLARGHTTLNEFRNGTNSDLGKVELFANALNCWNSSPKTGKTMQGALQDMGRCISLLAYNGKGNYQNQCCPEGYSNIEWRNVLCDLLVKASSTSGVFPFGDLTWSQWAGNVKKLLETYWSNFVAPTKTFDEIKTKIKAPNGDASKTVSSKIRNADPKYSDKLRMTTFHDVKGETLSAALIVSSKGRQSKGGYFEHWLTDKADEKEFVRFAYVASSRPKHLLIWAIPKIANNAYLQKILDLGFKIE